MNKFDVEVRYFPSKEFKYFLYDPENDFMYFKSKKDRKEVEQTIIMNYCDDGWDETVENILVGEITGVCEQTNVTKRPPVEELDENNHDADGNYWGEFDGYCNYEIVPLK